MVSDVLMIVLQQ